MVIARRGRVAATRPVRLTGSSRRGRSQPSSRTHDSRISRPPPADPVGQDPGAGLDLVERHVLICAVRDPDVARAEDHARRVAVVDEHLHVGAVGFAKERRPAARHSLDDCGEAGRQRVVGRDARRAEPAAGDLDRRGMVPQEVVRGTRRGDRGSQVGLRVGRRLPEPDAIAAVGDDLVEDRRCPLAAVDDPDDRRVRQSKGGHQRIGLCLVPASLVRLERPRELEQLVERGDALASLRRVGRPSRHGKAERDRTGVGDDDVELSRAR